MGDYEWFDGVGWTDAETFIDHTNAGSYVIPAGAWSDRDGSYELAVAVQDSGGLNSAYSSVTLNPSEWWNGSEWVDTEVWIAHTDIDSIAIPSGSFVGNATYQLAVAVEDSGGLRSLYSDENQAQIIAGTFMKVRVDGSYDIGRYRVRSGGSWT